MKRTFATAVAIVALLAAAPAGAQERASAQLSLASQTSWVRPGVPFTVRLDVDRVRRPQQLDMVVVVHRAVTSRSQFARTLDGDLLGPSVRRDRVPFDTLRFDPGGAVPVSIDVPDLRPGVYPVSIELVDTARDTTVASLVTHLVRVPDVKVEVPLSVAWVQPYGADPATQPDGTVDLGDAELDDLRTIAAHLDDGVPLTIVPTPETIAALRTTDGEGTLAALAALLQGHEVLATPYVDLDPAAMVGAGLSSEIGRQRFTGDTVLRDLLDLSADNRTWSIDGPVTRSSIAALAALGIARVIVDEVALEPLSSAVTGGLTLARPFEMAGTGEATVQAASVDPGLQAHFDEPDDVLAAHHLLADLAVLHFDAPGTARGIVVRPPADWAPSDALLSTVMAGLASSPLLQPTTVDRLLATIDPVTDDGSTVVRTPADLRVAPLGIGRSDIDRASARREGFAAIAGTTAADIDLMERLTLVAESSDLQPSTRRSYLAAVDARLGDTTARVRVLGDRTYRLTAREGKIPLTIVNDNPFDVRVRLELTSDKLTFTDSSEAGRVEIDDLALRANGTTIEVVPVKALTSGQFQLRVVMQSPDSRLELGRTTFTITSTVASGVGIVLSVGAALFLALWWGSHWRTVRRARRLVAADE